MFAKFADLNSDFDDLILAAQENTQESSVEIVEKYGVTIRKRNGNRWQSYLRWEGVILNERFVLSADIFDGKQE